MGRIYDLVPRGRRYASDFKCPAPGEDETSLLLDLAGLARLEVSCGERELPTGQVVLYARCGRATTQLVMPREKYAFPPVAMLRYLNQLLGARRDPAPRRLVACHDGPPWHAGNDGSVVVLIDADEERALRDAGVTVHDDRDDPRFRVEPVPRRRRR